MRGFHHLSLISFRLDIFHEKESSHSMLMRGKISCVSMVSSMKCFSFFLRRSCFALYNAIFYGPFSFFLSLTCHRDFPYVTPMNHTQFLSLEFTYIRKGFSRQLLCKYRISQGLILLSWITCSSHLGLGRFPVRFQRSWTHLWNIGLGMAPQCY